MVGLNNSRALALMNAHSSCRLLGFYIPTRKRHLHTTYAEAGALLCCLPLSPDSFEEEDVIRYELINKPKGFRNVARLGIHLALDCKYIRFWVAGLKI
jgi:hypothetical protein